MTAATQTPSAVILAKLTAIEADLGDARQKLDCLITDVATTRIVVSNLEKQVLGNGRAGLMDRVTILEQRLEVVQQEGESEAKEQAEYRKIRLQDSLDTKKDARTYKYTRALQILSLVGSVITITLSAVITYVLTQLGK